MQIQLAETAHWQIMVASENATILYFKNTDSQSISRVAGLIHQIKSYQQQWHIVRLLPSYQSLLIEFDILQTDHHKVTEQINLLLNEPIGSNSNSGKNIELPIYYGQEVAPDLSRIAEHAQITTDDVIKIHQQQKYHVYAIGFAPGFAYLGYVDKKIAMPRHETPRANVAQGSLGIADRQTAVYPMASPGGWNIIGRCPTKLFQPNHQPIMPFEVGDTVSFYAVERDEFLRLGGQL